MRFMKAGRSAVPRDTPWLGFPLLPRSFLSTNVLPLVKRLFCH